MLIRYIFKQLLLPPGGLLLLMLAAWWMRRRFPRLARACFVLGFGGLWLMSLPIMVEWSAALIEREAPLLEAQWPGLAQRADAIVVLGGGREPGDPAWGSDQPAFAAVERLRYAARLAKASNLPVLTSGGLPYGKPPSEAALMADSLARDFGVIARWQEEQSHTTWENARDSAELLAGQGIRRIVLVTQASHMPRARWCFEQAGFEVIVAPFGYLSVPNGRPGGGWLPEGKALWQSTQLLNEVLGQLVYPLVYR
ncbi:YdcF family protein [Pseudomonas sp. LS44]|uniref:YdcF family protein n=1 Tax=Pseudomonas sp. LS44 TaxID=1357074 RepID=UPI00215AAAF4|nr:YdcF family protein [Pseudomonas sp. LS44]UVE17179.1 YdcF family protein [Pseudomonas sp. LS44]